MIGSRGPGREQDERASPAASPAALRDPLLRHNVTVAGSGAETLVFAHGFGCDQNIWRLVAPAFSATHRLALFDWPGCGGAPAEAFDPVRHRTLQGYADDLLAICAALSLKDAVFIGHSVSAMIGLLAAIREPTRFSRLVLVTPSPCYLNAEGYAGGFEPEDIDELLELFENNRLGWPAALAPLVMGNPERPDLTAELEASFCRTDPEVARSFARVTFLSDNREDLPQVRTPSLILQCAQDVIAPETVGAYMHRAMRDSRLVTLSASGHCPQLSAPEDTIAAIRTYLGIRHG
ncbi:alpha/beta fold hydrolase [Arenibaculum pallidiluteum]|uniref:alpha/beta fold hydrolase n=1 Tax=Arenibaculum pallidiluteum TaxID=2812559 RepID=UPI001F355444|nr:alpha/beta hydrolase [Arenibaculum pallidiluteum]